MQIHWPEFKRYDETHDIKLRKALETYLCTAGPPFWLYRWPGDANPRTIMFWTRWGQHGFDVNDADGSLAKRTENKTYHGLGPNNRTNPHYNRLIVDDYQDHTAKDLCESPTSWGPDFVNVIEGLFCHMTDKTLWPVCNSELVNDCFSVDSRMLVRKGVRARSPYTDVLDWRENLTEVH